MTDDCRLWPLKGYIPKRFKARIISSLKQSGRRLNRIPGLVSKFLLMLPSGTLTSTMSNSLSRDSNGDVWFPEEAFPFSDILQCIQMDLDGVSQVFRRFIYRIATT